MNSLSNILDMVCRLQVGFVITGNIWVELLFLQQWGDRDDVAGWLVRERRSLDILPVKKKAKLSASEVPGEVVGSGEEDLRCRSLLTVCQRRLGLSEAEDARLEKYFFGRQDELVVLVAERLEGGPVSSRVSTFPDVFSVV